MKVKRNGEMCTVDIAQYGNGRPAIQLMAPDGQVMSVATVNLPKAEIGDTHVCVKNYSENDGLLEILQNAGVIGHTVFKLPVGYDEVHVCELLYKGEENYA